jgi:hypothetical protein
MRIAPTICLCFQAACPFIVALYLLVSLPSTRAEAETRMGPPYYLPFLLASILLASVFSVVTLLLWLWRPIGWCLSIFWTLALLCWPQEMVCTSSFGMTGAPLGYFLFLFGVAAWFGTLSALLVTRQSLSFFRVIYEEPRLNHQQAL